MVVVVVKKKGFPGAAVIPNEDDSYTILANSDYSEEKIREKVIHELRHIQRGDFSSNYSASIIERNIRSSTDEIDFSDIIFFFYTD